MLSIVIGETFKVIDYSGRRIRRPTTKPTITAKAMFANASTSSILSIL